MGKCLVKKGIKEADEMWVTGIYRRSSTDHGCLVSTSGRLLEGKTMCMFYEFCSNRRTSR